MLKFLKNPFVIVTLLFIFFTAKFAITRQYPVIQEVNITYSDDIDAYVSNVYARSGEKQYAYIIRHDNVTYRTFDTKHEDINIAENYVKGDYFKNLKILYPTSEFRYLNNQKYYDSTKIVEGEYYSNKLGKSVKLRGVGITLWKSVAYSADYLGYCLIYFISILIIIIWKRRHFLDWTRL